MQARGAVRHSISAPFYCTKLETFITSDRNIHTMWASKFLKGRNARSITKTSMAAAASAPTSQAEFSANSQAFSVAVTELLECLDFVFDQLDDQGKYSFPVYM